MYRVLMWLLMWITVVIDITDERSKECVFQINRFCFLLCLKHQRLFSDSSLSSSDFSLKQRNVPSLRRLRGWGCSTKKTTQTISTSLGDARAINRTRVTADLRWSNSSSRSRACIKWTRVWPGWLAQGKWTSITIQTEQVMTLWYSFLFFSLFLVKCENAD